jgi:hypothetical protein
MIVALGQGSSTLTVKVTVELAVSCWAAEELAESVRFVDYPFSEGVNEWIEILRVVELTETPKVVASAAAKL